MSIEHISDLRYALLLFGGDHLKIGVGLSGGVDSAISAYSLLKKGYEVKGYTMHLFDSQDAEIESAVNTAKQIGIPHSIIDLREEFKDEVISEFIEYYKNGLTPNPCLICNKKIKYGKLIEYALKDGMDGFAMGHHVKKGYDEALGEYIVLRSDDKRKDQSYNLFRLTQKQLSYLHFPAGEFKSKNELRNIAEEIGLSVAEKSDSTGICFLGKMSMKSYLKEIDDELNRPGPIVDTEDNYLGRHQGIYKYTIGQKKRLPKDLAEYNSKNPDNPFTVIGIDAKENKVIVGNEKLLFKTKIYLVDTSFISEKHEFPLKVSVKLSQWSEEYSATVHRASENDFYLIFIEPARAPAPGQAAVFYDGDRLLGGGIITDSE